MRVGLLGEASQREGKAVRLGGELADSGALHRGAPGDRAAENAVFAHDLADQQLGNAVLEGDDDTVLGEEILQEGDDLGVLLLLGEQEDDVVLAAHLFVREGGDFLCELEGSDHLGTVLL